MELQIANVEDYFKGMRRCIRCVLPETFPGIKYDADGVCSYCKTYEPMKPQGEQEFLKLLDSYRSKGDKYDVLVPISGGRDSSFALHQMVKKYDVRVMAITVDTGFLTDEGFMNLRAAVQRLNTPHVILKNEKKIKIARANTKIKFRGWVRNPSIHTIVPVLNSGDKTMNYRMYKYAAENAIPLVLGGNIIGNASVEQDHWKTGYLGVFPDERGVYTAKDKFRLLGKYALEYSKNADNYRLPILTEYLMGFYTYFFDSLRRPKGVESAGFYDYIYWNEKEILATITSELSWKGAKDTETTWRIDDSAYPMINYLLCKLVGFTEHDEMYSKMIREGQLNRAEALNRLAEDHKPRLARLEKDFIEFEIAKEQLDSALKEYRKKLLMKVLKPHYRNIHIS